MKRTRRLITGAVLACALTLAFVPAWPAPQAYAAKANDSFIEEIGRRYDELESKYRNLYEADKKKFTEAYDAFYKQIHDEQETFNRLVKDDLDALADLLGRDHASLSDQYTSRTYMEPLNVYKRQINPNYTSGAMWKYATAANENYTSSTHWRFHTQINENYSSSLMWHYHNELNPYYSSSTMWNYSNQMNPNYSNSAMWKLRNESNPSYSGGTMWKYRIGKLTRAQAEQQMNAVLTEGEERLQEIRAESVASLEKTQQDTQRKLTELRDETVGKVLEQRASSLDEIMSIRERHFGGKLAIKPLVISFDKIKVVIDGELQRFEQPPVNKDGSVLVPMRAIFEKLGAKITWNDTERSVTAVKGDVTIYLQIGSTEPTVNGVAKPLEVPAQLVNSYTMVPVRFISESLGAEVDWDQATQTVYIRTK